MSFIKYATGLPGLSQVLDVRCLFFFQVELQSLVSETQEHRPWSPRPPTQIYWVDPGPRQIQEPALLRSGNHCLLAETDKEIITVSCRVMQPEMRQTKPVRL